MKHLLTYLAAFTLTLTTLSCRKEGHERRDRQIETSAVVTASVRAGQTYVLNLEAGSEANISEQASHYEVSEVSTALDGNLVYRYMAAKGFTGVDKVTLQQTTKTISSGGACNDNYSGSTTTLKAIVIKLNVAD